MTNHRYWSLNGKGCALKNRCTPSLNRRVTGWEHQDVLEEMQARLDENPDTMHIRRSSVEHPYGTITAWMGATHFLTKGLEHVKTGMNAHVLACNFRRLLALQGMASLMQAGDQGLGPFLRRYSALWDTMLLALPERSTAICDAPQRVSQLALTIL